MLGSQIGQGIWIRESLERFFKLEYRYLTPVYPYWYRIRKNNDILVYWYSVPHLVSTQTVLLLRCFPSFGWWDCTRKVLPFTRCTSKAVLRHNMSIWLFTDCFLFLLTAVHGRKKNIVKSRLLPHLNTNHAGCVTALTGLHGHINEKCKGSTTHTCFSRGNVAWMLFVCQISLSIEWR